MLISWSDRMQTLNDAAFYQSPEVPMPTRERRQCEFCQAFLSALNKSTVCYPCQDAGKGVSTSTDGEEEQAPPVISDEFDGLPRDKRRAIQRDRVFAVMRDLGRFSSTDLVSAGVLRHRNAATSIIPMATRRGLVVLEDEERVHRSCGTSYMVKVYRWIGD